MLLLLSYNLRNVMRRWQASSLAMFGIALVVLVLLGLDAMSNGFTRTLGATGRTDNAIATQKGASSELTSGVGNDQVAVLVADDRIVRNASGVPLASPEMVVVANLQRREDGQSTNVLLRGVTPLAYEVRQGIELVSGRKPIPGLAEIIVGSRITKRIKDLELGGTLRLKRVDWKVVGVFRASGSGFESEIWGDASVLRQVFGRTNGWNSVTMRLPTEATMARLETELEADPRFQIDVKQEQRYYADQAGAIATQLQFLAGFTAILMGIGAAFGAINTMYGVVASRAREIGTLRALGFPRWLIVLGFILESVLLALAGGIAGVAVGALVTRWIGDDWAFGNAFSELAFAFRVTPQGVFNGLAFAVIMGLIGGLLPALRAARIPVTAALRDA